MKKFSIKNDAGSEVPRRAGFFGLSLRVEHTDRHRNSETTIQPTRRDILKAGLIAAAIAGTDRLTRRAIAAAPVNRPPNIILLVTDDQRSDSLSCAGNTVLKTPHIDNLAKNGVRFRNSFATTAICMASRASILTGLHTSAHGVNDFQKPLDDSLFEQSYPKLLRNAGYYMGFIGKWGVDGGKMPVANYDYFKGYQGQGAYFSSKTNKHLTVVETEQAIEFLHGCPAQKPFCLAISFKAPHVQDEGRGMPGMYAKYPYDKALDHLYENDVVPAIKTNDVTPQPGFLKTSLNGTREAPDFLPATYQEAMKDLYRLLTGVDQAVGKIVAELKSLGIDDNTVILYTADHGSFYGEHGFGGKWLMHEESIRTPMVLYDPRLPANQRGIVHDQMALNIDVPATLLDLAGIARPIGMQGRSLLPLIRSEKVEWRSDWFYDHQFRDGNPPAIIASQGVRTADWKYIRYIDYIPVFEQLFDLKNDPREEKNLAGNANYADQLTALRTRWQVWRSALDQHTMGKHWADPA